MKYSFLEIVNVKFFLKSITFVNVFVIRLKDIRLICSVATISTTSSSMQHLEKWSYMVHVV
jgi:hypothetical protein